MRNWQQDFPRRGVSSALLGAACALVTASTFVTPVTAEAADRLGNISTRGKVLTGAGNEMIAGFIVQGDTTKCGVVRARGESMGISGFLADPVLTIKKRVKLPNGKYAWEVYATNDNWQDQEIPGDEAIIEDLGKAPGAPLEAAIYGCFSPSTPYTAIITSAQTGGEGIALAEVIDADPIEEIQAVDGDLGALQAQIDDLQAQVNSLLAAVNGLQANSHDRYTDAEAIAAVGATGGDHPRYTDAEAIAAVQTILAPVATSGSYSSLTGRPALKAVATSGSYTDLLNRPALKAVATSGNYNDLLNRPSLAPVALSGDYFDLLNAPTGDGGGSDHPALAYMDVYGGELVISGIDVRIQDGNMLIGTGGTGVGLHNLIIGENNVWDGDYGLIHGSYHKTTADYGAAVGGMGNTIRKPNGVIVGGNLNAIQSYGFVTILGGKSAYDSSSSAAYGAVIKQLVQP